MTKPTSLVVFAYNFVHRKTQDFILRLFLEGYKPSLIIAADPVKLKIPPSTIKSKIRHQAIVHPSEVAKTLDIEYVVLPHNSSDCAALLKSVNPEVGIIAGARILKEPAIEPFTKGIINFHPGLIPEARGLDALLWSIYNDVPLGITAHIIDKYIDAGKILAKKEIPIYSNDTLFDLSERLYEIQLDLLKPSIEALLTGNIDSLVSLNTPYNRKMPPELEAEVLKKVSGFIERHCKKN